MLHIDATYKLSSNKLSTLIICFSDANRKYFHLTEIGFQTYHNSAQIMYSPLNFILTIYVHRPCLTVGGRGQHVFNE